MANDWWLKIIGEDRPVYIGYRPDIRDSFYCPLHGSGWVIWIDYFDRTVRVGYADKTRSVYSWEEVENNYSPSYGGIWIMDY
jgi:hypothetical protein